MGSRVTAVNVDQFTTPWIRELLRFLQRTLWTLIMLIASITIVIAGYFITDPKLAGIAAAFGIGMATISISIYAVFALLRFSGK